MAASKPLSEQLNDITECPICAETFTDPKVLPCVHTFCLKCLLKYGEHKKPGNRVPCPLCRSNFVIPPGGFTDLPNNFFVNKLLLVTNSLNETHVSSGSSACTSTGNPGENQRTTENGTTSHYVPYVPMPVFQPRQRKPRRKKPDKSGDEARYEAPHYPIKQVPRESEDDVHLSRTMAFLLRHGAQKCRVPMQSDGFVRVDDLLRYKDLNYYTRDDVERVVVNSSKQRFEMKFDGSVMKVRANWGHSLRVDDL